MNRPKIAFGEISVLRNGVNFVVADHGVTTRVVGVGDFQTRSEISEYNDLSEIQLKGDLSPEDELRDGDLLFVRSNGNKNLVGRCLVIRRPPRGIAFSGFTIRARLDKSTALPDYIALVFQGGALNRQMALAGGGNGNISNLNQSLLASMPLTLPDLNDQQHVVTCISTWNAAIETTERLITAKGQRLGAIRKNLFIRSSRSGYVRVRLDTVLKETEDLSDGNLPVYSVSVHKGLINQVEHLGRSFSAATTTHYNLVRPGDIVYTKSPTGEFPYGIVKQSLAKENAAVSPLYGVYRPSTNDIGTLIDFFFESPANSKNYLYPLVQRGAKNTISIGNDRFLQGEVTLPGSPEQIARLASFIREARTEIGLLKKSVAALTKQKRGLMQKLLTGQWRVKVPETEAA